LNGGQAQKQQAFHSTIKIQQSTIAILRVSLPPW
jgi:hypothetical protein